ncbi:IS5/IS1182 family transposase, partial [Candidatus Micrarchaeota archaeon]|nr:IS5/IS1182 family transposase [Candidatus Micrarchaeota archaeon]
IFKPDENARDDTESKLRNQVVKERNLLGHKRWAKKNRYGFRWPATEGIFSALKRLFGEQLAATSEKGMLQEAACKLWAYQRIKRFGEA